MHGYNQPPEPTSRNERKRIFWLGAHQVLTKTELPRLRQLGYEVLNPPYNSDVADQSVVVGWQVPADTTLPPEVLAKLAVTEFFYKPIAQEISEILNHYFDAVIVTINPGWLHEFLRAYRGPIIYRVYGQPYSLSNELMNNATAPLIAERDQFWFAPHSDKVLQIEDPWLQSNMRIIPYCLTDDVVALRDTWLYKSESKPEIGMLCPRALDIPYYSNNYMHLSHYFPGPNYRIFGAQIVPVDNPKVIGTLDRTEFLQRMQRLRGYIYHYDEPTVCYLPPIEFMTLGGPVVYQRGSLLARYFEEGERAPGCAKDFHALVEIARRVEEGDRSLISEIIDSQRPVRQIYQPDHVWPIFDREMRRMLDGHERAPASRFMLTSLETGRSTGPSKASSTGPKQEILVAFHAFGPHVQKHDDQYHCAEGIARVIRQGVRALTAAGYDVIVTAHKADVGRIHGYFQSHALKHRVRVLAIDGDFSNEPSTSLRSAISDRIPLARLMSYYQVARTRLAHLLSMPLNAILSPRYLVSIILLLPIIVLFSLLRSAKRRTQALLLRVRVARGKKPPDYVRQTSERDSIVGVLVPHYYLFPETADIRAKRLALYLPDYLPHFYPDQPEMGADPFNRRIGRKICKRADRIFTNSKFTQSYLPTTELEVEPGKVVYFPLPDLGEQPNFMSRDDTSAVPGLPELYVFYPTRERPSKRLGDFVKTVAEVNRQLAERGTEKRLYGVLTAPASERMFAQCPEARLYIKSLPELSDVQLRLVYGRALALLFTSELEGNFPTQINEALNARIPIVATRIPLICDEVGKWASHLSLVDVGDIKAFATAILDIMDDPNAILARQEPLRAHLLDAFSFERFATGIVSVFRKHRADDSSVSRV